MSPSRSLKQQGLGFAIFAIFLKLLFLILVLASSANRGLLGWSGQSGRKAWGKDQHQLDNCQENGTARHESVQTSGYIYIYE